MKILVVIANHGVKNQHYLDQLLTAYREMPVEKKIIVLSDVSKDLGSDVEVKVGAPTSNPWSLPFGHRKIFIDEVNNYDYFIYSEDDTLLSWTALEAFVESCAVLRDDEIAGFIRTEISQDGEVYYSSCHSFFRWVPSSVCERGGLLWAKYSNEHAACYVVSQQQLRRAIFSGGFVIAPHEGRHDMLCAAATDIYTQCGFRRLICLDNLESFTLPHLPNKYIGRMGLRADELLWQVSSMKDIYEQSLSQYELLSPETKLPGSRGSKFYRELPDEMFNKMLDGASGRNVLVFASGDGVFEKQLQNKGYSVSVVPLDAVMAGVCRKRGLDVLSLDSLCSKQMAGKFDVLILRDVLHLVEDPGLLLSSLLSLLTSDGKLLVRIPNFYDIGLIKKRLMDKRYKVPWTQQFLRARPFKVAEMMLLLEMFGLGQIQALYDIPPNRHKLDRLLLGSITRFLSPYLYFESNKCK